jgi:adenosylcobalamin-dependent ribonucleoside-triphosphate reductase
VQGNLALVYGNDIMSWPTEILNEQERLAYYMNEMALLPAGRHLWATGVPGRQYLFNCHVAGWGEELSDHFEFSFLRLMEGGGVGANYSTKNIAKFGAPSTHVNVHVIVDDNHQDINELRPHLSTWFGPGTLSDLHVNDSREGWAMALVDLIECFYGLTRPLNENTVIYDVSSVRPSGSELKTFGGTASGPAPLARMLLEVANILNDAHTTGTLTPLHVMEIDHAIAECVVSGGNRRSARMSIVHWADPYIMDFLACKQDTGKHWTTNISVEIDDEFLRQLGIYEQSWGKQVHHEVVKGMLENGEPGYWNSSLSNKGEINSVEATNPCGEIALEPFENCNLGHVNMDWFHDKPKHVLHEAHRLMTRFLIRATYGDVNDSKQAEKLALNRRVGVGHLGVQGYWAKQGVKYSDIPFYAADELDTLYQVVRQEAREYAFKLRIPEPVKVTAIAPTGSVAKLPGVSEGIHPIYARWFERRVRFSKRDEAQFGTVMEAMNKGFTVEDDVYDKSGMTAVVVYPTEELLMSQVRSLGIDDSVVESADELNIRHMLAVQKVYQEHYADNAVSYTVNIVDGDLNAQELGAVLAEFLPDLKGTTVMVDASRPQAPYTRITREQYEAAVATSIEDGISEECQKGSCPVR